MAEYIWFILIIWILLMAFGESKNNEVIRLSAGLTGLIFSITLMGEAETSVNYVGYLLLAINLIYLVYLPFHRR